MSGFPAPESFEPRAMPAKDRRRGFTTWDKSSRFGQIHVIHTNNARSLPRSRRRGGARLKAMLELMTEKQILGYEPASRLEQVGDEHCKQMKDRQHHVE